MTSILGKTKNCADNHTNFSFKEGDHMRHFYIRLVIGIIWLIAAAVTLMSGNLSAGAFSAVFGVMFIVSAFSIRKKNTNDR